MADKIVQVNIIDKESRDAMRMKYSPIKHGDKGTEVQGIADAGTQEHDCLITRTIGEPVEIVDRLYSGSKQELESLLASHLETHRTWDEYCEPCEVDD